MEKRYPTSDLVFDPLPSHSIAIRPLYKYLPELHARSLVDKGEVLVTTLEKCRQAEMGRERTDPDEGTRLTIAPRQTFSWEGKGSADPFFDRFIGGTGKGIRFIDSTFRLREVSEDLFIYCTTSRFDRALMEEFGCDACVRIDNSWEFLRAVTDALGARVQRPWRWGPCVYRTREQHFQKRDIDRVDPAFLKDESYNRQREVRAVWTPSSQPIKPVILTAPVVVRYCTLHWPRSE